MSLIDRFQSWFDYEVEAHAKTLDSLDTVPPEGRDDEYRRALDLLAHVFACRRLWLHRIGAVSSGPASDAEILPHGVERAELDDRLAAMIADWSPYLTRLDHRELGRRFEYTSTEEDRFSNTVEEILTQLFGHAWHHRGQILAIVRAAGGRPEAADYVYWTRRRLD